MLSNNITTNFVTRNILQLIGSNFMKIASCALAAFSQASTNNWVTTRQTVQRVDKNRYINPTSYYNTLLYVICFVI